MVQHIVSLFYSLLTAVCEFTENRFFHSLKTCPICNNRIRKSASRDTYKNSLTDFMTESITTHLPKLADQLGTPITIGGKSIPNRLWLAPMAGLTHTAFRQVLAHYGSCGLAFTEMCSARAVPTENPRISPVFSWHEWELPSLVCQIVGAEPEEW